MFGAYHREHAKVTNTDACLCGQIFKPCHFKIVSTVTVLVCLFFSLSFFFIKIAFNAI